MPMFLAAAADDPDPGVVEIMEWLAALSSNPANQYERYEKGGHGVEMLAAHQQLGGEIVVWLGRVLRSRPGEASAKAAPAPSAQTRFLEATDRPGGPAKAAQLFAQARARDPHAVIFTEAVLNRVGYDHLQAGDKQGAIELFQLNVIAYSHSPNVYDSLSDGYLANGQKELARQNAQKALDFLTTDTTDPEDRRKGIRDNAERKLKQLAAAPY